VAPSQIGSVEFAAERFGTRLVVVLGHTNCGAITRLWRAKPCAPMCVCRRTISGMVRRSSSA
jgi:hypothetical protein